MNVAKLRGVMAEKGFTQKELAKRLGWSERTLYLRLANGKFGTDEAQRIGDIMGIERQTLIDIFLPNKSL